MTRIATIAVALGLLFACGGNKPAQDEPPQDAPEMAADVEQDGPEADQAAGEKAASEHDAHEEHEGHEGEHKENKVAEAGHQEEITEGAYEEGKLADGEICLSHDDCGSGICEGEGCDDENPGTCVSKLRACTRDMRGFCDCEGVSFTASSSCPAQRYAHKGPCRPDE